MTGDPKAAALAELRRIHQTRLDLERAELEAVARARAADAQWTEIGEAVGMRRQHASRKFKPLLEENKTVRPRRR